MVQDGEPGCRGRQGSKFGVRWSQIDEKNLGRLEIHGCQGVIVVPARPIVCLAAPDAPHGERGAKAVGTARVIEAMSIHLGELNGSSWTPRASDGMFGSPRVRCRGAAVCLEWFG